MEEFQKEKYTTIPFAQRVEKPWGEEVIYTPDYSPAVGKIIHVKAGERISLQYHDKKIETLCLVAGEGRITLANPEGELTEAVMEKDKGYFVHPGQIHRVTAVSDITFIEASTPEFGNTFRVEDDHNRPTETEAMREAERNQTAD